MAIHDPVYLVFTEEAIQMELKVPMELYNL